MAQSIMIIGSGNYQVPAIKMARNMGVFVVTVDRDPHAEGFKYAHEGIPVDIASLDECLEVARQYRVKAVMTIASDLASKAVSYIVSKMGLIGPSIEVTDTLFDKSRFYKVLEKAAVPFTRWVEVTSLEKALKKSSKLDFPLILKPSDSAGSRGVRKVFSGDDIKRGFNATLEFSLKGSVLLCEFIEGGEYGFEGFMYNGKLVFSLVTKKTMSPPPCFVEVGHMLPVVMSPEKVGELKNLVEKTANAVGYPSGPLNADVILSKDGFRLLEMGARLGGNFLPQLIRIHSGVCTIEQTIRYALGEEPVFNRQNSRPCAIHILFSQKEGVVRSIDVPVDVLADPGVAEITIDAKKGAHVFPGISSNFRLGHVIATGITARLAAEKAKELVERIKLDIE